MSSNIDPASWMSAERTMVSTFAASQARAQMDLATNVAAFQAEASQMIQSEQEFAKDLMTLAASVDDAAIDQTLQAVQAASSGVDATFAQLNSLIVANNATATQLTGTISAASANVQRINDAQSTLDANVTSYSSILYSFRSFASSSQATAPAPESS